MMIEEEVEFFIQWEEFEFFIQWGEFKFCIQSEALRFLINDDGGADATVFLRLLSSSCRALSF